MKQKLLLLALLAQVCSLTAMGYDAYIDGIYYEFSGLNASVVSGDVPYSGSIVIPQFVTYNDRTYEVTGISNSAFRNCSVSSVSIPNSITEMGSYAFTDCHNLRSVNIPTGITYIGSGQFAGCYALSSITIPESVTAIGYEAFSRCHSLITVVIPNSVNSIGYKAFYDCPALSTITISNSVTDIDGTAFEGTAWLNNQPDGLVYAGKVSYKYKGTMPENTEIEIKEGTLSIASHAFENCSGLTSVIFPEGITKIGYEAFKGTEWFEDQPEGLVYAGKVAYKYKGTMPEDTTIDIKDGTHAIADYAFSSCRNLKSVTFPESLTSIGDYAFGGCSGLTSIILPEELKTIGNSAFGGCSGLTSIILPEGITDIGHSAFSNCGALKSITIPESVTNLGSRSFENCFSLSSITIPQSIKTIGSSLFWQDYNLRSIIIPEGVTSIGENAFDGTGITSITIPASVTKIAHDAFLYCSSLSSIVVEEGNVVYDSRNDCNAIIETASNTLIVGGSKSTIPEGVTSIGSYAFCRRGPASISIPTSVTNIDKYAFTECNGIRYIVVKEGNKVFDSRNDCNAIIETATNTLIVGCANTSIPEGVTTIGDRAFYDLNVLTSISIPEGVTAIGKGAFQDCSNLRTVIFPNSITSIGASAFGNTPWDKNLTEGLVYVGKVVYKYNGTMSGNTSLDIMEGTLGIAGGAFHGCNGLSSINIPKSVTNIGESAFGYCENLTSIIIPEGVTNIDDYTFLGCRSLTSIIIPNSVTSIGREAFYGCENLTSITIPDGVSTIELYTFANCKSLTSISIPEGMTSIGEYAFLGVEHASIRVGMRTPISIPYNIFERFWGNNLYVPKGSKEAYQTADVWKDFGEIIECDYVDVTEQTIAVGGSTTMEISVNNFDTDLVAFQMDLTLPEGISLDKTGCSLSSRITDKEQELTIGKLENGAYRFTSSSLSLTPISGNEGTLLLLKLTAEEGSVGGKATISNIRFSTSESKRVIMDDKTFDISVMYKVIYKVDGEEYKTVNVVYNTQPTLEAEPTKEGHTFSGWSEMPETMPAHNVEVTGSFSVNSYNLTYKVDGEVYKTYTVEYGTALTAEAAPTKEGNTFSGWSELPETMPAHDVEVTGSFTINKYKLTYIVDGVEYKSYEIDYATLITPEAAPSKEGYTFIGWSGLPEIMPAHDVEVTGTFTNKSYTLTYLVDGEPYKTSSVAYGSNLTLEAEPTKDGYTFGGWSELPETMPAHDVEVTGRFYLFGDVNTDEEVDVVDVVDVARFVVATPSEKFREKLADLNFDNTVNLGDAVVLVNHIAGDQNFVREMFTSERSTNTGVLSLTRNGKTLALNLTCGQAYTAFQFDLYVAEDTDITLMMLNGQRKQKHQLLYNKVEDGHYRVAALSTTNNTFLGAAGELLSFVMDDAQDTDVEISNIHFFDTKGNDYAFDTIGVDQETGVNNVNDNVNGNDAIYDLQGRKLSRMQRGVNVIGGKKILVK